VAGLLCASSWGDSAERQPAGRGGYDEGHCEWGGVTLDFLASGLRPRASVEVVVCSGVVVVTAGLASGFRPCASDLGACACIPQSRGQGPVAASLMVALRWWCGVGGGVGGVSALSA
jgi:hypothetical protein